MSLTNFPTSLDSITNRSDNVDDVLAAHINLCNDAIEAIEAKLGIDSSAVVTSIEYLLKNPSSHNVGHTHSLTTGANDVTATKDELNILDGATLTVTELNYLDGASANLKTFVLPASTTISAFGRTVVDDADAGAVRTTIGCPSDPAAATPGLRTIGTGAVQACAGNDARLSNTRIPTDGSVTAVKLGAAAVSQSKLKTSGQEQYAVIDGGLTRLFTLTGGQYVFAPQFRAATATNTTIGIFPSSTLDTTYSGPYVYVQNASTFNNRTFYVKHRYITSSGEITWLFFLREKQTKKIIGASIAPDHPCFGNGGKPLLVPHPFEHYDETKHEIIVINPTNEEIEQMELETIVDDETKPDKDLLEVITENYEIDENSSPAWPTKEVTVGLPKHIFNKKINKKVLVDYRFLPPGTIITPIKKKIPKPSYIKTKRLKRK